ncbi:MAG TPA: glycoside hydrolase family 99-like domain-containing protein [Bryobacteraceae bacterium]|nr:glycoside hydrolase family 99-like domain-containing protein [Bryobacteraceae bacterium]
MKPLAACVVALTIAARIPAAGPPPVRADIHWTNVPHEVLAFYYGWYGNPRVSDRWVHWKNVDAAAHHIGESTHFPVLGAYDSHDPKIVEQHCRQAADAGITGFIVSWWRQGDFHDQGMALMLDTAQKHGLKITIYYETAATGGAPTADNAVNDLLYLASKYGSHPAWLKAGGKPVFFVYGRAIGELKVAGWEKVIDDFSAKDPAGAVFLADRIAPDAARVFDGVHTYNETGATQGKTPDQLRTWAEDTFPKWVATAGPDRIACVTIIPGYDDSVQPSRKPPRPITERHQGKTYEVMWQEAIYARPDWVLITSWNEWHEGSEIEPSMELGSTALDTTREFARKFMALPHRTLRK